MESPNSAAEIRQARDPQPQEVPAAAAGDLHGGQQEPYRGQVGREDRDVPGRRRVERDRRDPGRHGARQEQQALRGQVDTVAVVEDGEADPSPPQRHEQPERDPHAAHLGLVHDQVRELADRQHEHEVEIELDPAPPLARFAHAGRRPGHRL
jgi:hypothetical protein